MLENARKHQMMPEEVFSERNRMADDGTLTKVLAYDIIKQTRRPAGIASVDVDNCYDRIVHAITSLVFQAFGVPKTALELQNSLKINGTLMKHMMQPLLNHCTKNLFFMKNT